MAIRVNPLLLAGTAGSSTDPFPYKIAKSLRISASRTTTAYRTFALGNRKTWTWSGWVKRGQIGSYQVVFGANDNTNNNDSTYHTIAFGADDTIGVSLFSAWVRKSTRVFRDKHAWYHVVVAYDTTQATAQNRCRMWVNGDEITSWGTNTTITQNIDHGINAAQIHNIGKVNYSGAPGQFDGLVAEMHFVNGQALTAASFGEVSSITGQWVPKAYTGTYGTTGFWLDFNTDWTTGSSISGYTTLNYTSGSGYWVVPSNFYDCYGYLVGGGGGGGAGADSGGGRGIDGGYSQFNGAVAYGGQGGVSGYGGEGGGGAGGSFSGATNGAVGSAGSTSSAYSGGAGGWSGSGGAGGSQPGAGSPGLPGGTYGGGGSGGGGFLNAQGGGGGGGGAALISNVTYTLANVSPGQSLYWQAGAGGAGDAGTYAGGPGAHGIAQINYRTQSGGTLQKGLGDRSGNGNNFTGAGLRTDGVWNDNLTDSPTDNTPPVSGSAGGYTDYWGGTVGYNPNQSWGTTNIPVLIPRGKWFVEGFALSVSGTAYPGLGMRPAGNVTGVEYVGDRANSMGVIANATSLIAYQNNVQGGSIARSNASGVVMALGVDMDAGKAWLGGGNSSEGYAWIGGGNPEAGTLPTYTFATELEYFFALSMYGNTTHWNAGHFGGGWSSLKPASFKWFRASNFDTPAIPKSDTAFDTDLWTGNAALRKIVTPFDPHAVWIKQRSGTQINIVVDRDRGDIKTLATDSPGNEGTLADSVFLSTTTLGYELGQSAFVNQLSAANVGWAFRKGAAYGFDVQGYAGNGVGVRNIAHNLGALPEMYWVKRRDLDGSWRVYHKNGSATPHTGCAFLEGSQAYTTTGIWGNQAPSPTTISVGTDPDVNASGGLYIVYLWRSVPGFSKFGKYVGSARADEGSTFIPLGFKPAFVMIKRVDSSGSWIVYDNKRDAQNPVYLALFPDLPDPEVSSIQCDFLSNGFKLRRADNGNNISGATYIYAAFAEAPYQFANAR